MKTFILTIVLALISSSVYAGELRTIISAISNKDVGVLMGSYLKKDHSYIIRIGSESKQVPCYCSIIDFKSKKKYSSFTEGYHKYNPQKSGIYTLDCKALSDEPVALAIMIIDNGKEM